MSKCYIRVIQVLFWAQTAIAMWWETSKHLTTSIWLSTIWNQVAIEKSKQRKMAWTPARLEAFFEFQFLVPSQWKFTRAVNLKTYFYVMVLLVLYLNWELYYFIAISPAGYTFAWSCCNKTHKTLLWCKDFINNIPQHSPWHDPNLSWHPNCPNWNIPVAPGGSWQPNG